MSMLERISKERTRYILFFTSTSVILITLGIIQTLLFEAIAFFSEVASTRGWFSFTVNLSGVASAAGLGALMLAGCAALEWRMRVDPKVLIRMPEKAMLPPKSARYAIAVAVLLVWLLIDSFVLRLVLLVVLFMWRRAANVFVLLPNNANKSLSLIHI